MVHSAGFEPATDGLEIRCSIQLSYECVKLIILLAGVVAHRLLHLVEPSLLRLHHF